MHCTVTPVSVISMILLDSPSPGSRSQSKIWTSAPLNVVQAPGAGLVPRIRS